LQQLLRDAIDATGLREYFLFDMSVPDAVQSLRAGLRIYTRHSDYEPVPALYTEASGVWMDGFNDYAWLTPDKIEAHLDRGKEVCIVSPELHSRPHMSFWRTLAASVAVESERLTLCTDFPTEARSFFTA
jgi:hypothetical protein